jgi:hypothetical protein
MSFYDDLKTAEVRQRAFARENLLVIGTLLVTAGWLILALILVICG